MSEALSFRSGARVLAGEVYSPADRAPSGAGIVFVHGSASSQEGYGPRAETAADRIGATCLTFDLSGHGGSGGSLDELSLRDHLADCLAAFDALLGQPGVDPDRVGVCGASYGGFLGALLIARRPTASLLLRAPAYTVTTTSIAPAAPASPPPRRLTVRRCATSPPTRSLSWSSSPNGTRSFPTRSSRRIWTPARPYATR